MGYTETNEKNISPFLKRGLDKRALERRPRGAITDTVPADAHPKMGSMPRGQSRTEPNITGNPGGVLPSSSAIFPRVKKMAMGLTPNPAEKIPGAIHEGTPPRMVGNFGDRKTSRMHLRIPYAPSGTDEAGVKGSHKGA